MKVVSVYKVDPAKYDLRTDSSVLCVHVQVDDIDAHAKNMISAIRDTSWISKLGIVEQHSYAARAAKTVEKMVKDVLEKISGFVTEEFGEYLVTESAKDALSSSFGHTKLPLAELWKEKSSGNPGFDFHTESNIKIIAFGEGKYSSTRNMHTVALSQIVRFIEDKKDVMELTDLKNFASTESIDNALNDRKAFVAAFSVNGKRYEQIFETAITSDELRYLTMYPEIYLIGIEVCQ